MAFLKNMEKMLSANHKLVLVGLLLLTLAIGLYSNKKGSITRESMVSSNKTVSSPKINGLRTSLVRPRRNNKREGFQNNGQTQGVTAQNNATVPMINNPRVPHGQGKPHTHAHDAVHGATTSAQDLLPSGVDSSNPSFASELAGVANFLEVGALQGEATNSGLKNPNQQLRADPPIPSGNNVGIWNNSTMAEDGPDLNGLREA